MAAAAAAAEPRMFNPAERGGRLLEDVAAAKAASNWERPGGLRCLLGGLRRPLEVEAEVEVVALVEPSFVVSLPPVPTAVEEEEEDIWEEEKGGRRDETSPRGEETKTPSGRMLLFSFRERGSDLTDLTD